MGIPNVVASANIKKNGLYSQLPLQRGDRLGEPAGELSELLANDNDCKNIYLSSLS
jgi:hypothetical protein